MLNSSFLKIELSVRRTLRMTCGLPETEKIVREYLPSDLCTVVIGYVQSAERLWRKIAFYGEYETCLLIPEVEADTGLYGACKGGHKELAEFMISRGANNYDLGLYGACKGGHMELAEFMIAHGASHWNWGLRGACKKGHEKLIEFMVDCGATGCIYCAGQGGSYTCAYAG